MVRQAEIIVRTEVQDAPVITHPNVWALRRRDLSLVLIQPTGADLIERFADVIGG
jgi:hypothetical protein